MVINTRRSFFFMKLLGIIFLFVFFSSLSTAQSLESSSSSASPLPFMVRPSDASLVSIATASSSATTVLSSESAAYARIRSQWDVAQSRGETSSSLRAQLVDARHRYLIAILNRITTIHYRLDFTISRLDHSLSRLSLIHTPSSHVSDFDSRWNRLSAQARSLEQDSDSLSALLESCPSEVNLGSCVARSRDAASALLSRMRVYLPEHRSLVADVLSP